MGSISGQGNKIPHTEERSPKKVKKKKKLSDKKKLREFSTTKSIYDKCLKNFSRLKTQERKRPVKNKFKAIKKMLIET